MLPELDLSILKTIITNKKYAIEFATNENEKLFVNDLWRFSKFIIEYIRTYKITPTKRVILEKVKQQKNDTLLKYIETTYSAVEEFKSDDKEYLHDLEKLKNRYAEKLIRSLKDNLDDGNGVIDVKKSFGDLQNTINNIKSINTAKSFKEGTLQDYMKDFKNIYEAKLKDPNFGVGFKTGYSFIDFATSGLREGELLLYAGTTGAGKSLMLSNSAVQLWMGDNTIDTFSNYRKGCNILLFSLEMNFTDYMERILARLAMVPQINLRDAKLTEEEKLRVAKAFKFISSYPYTFKIIDTPKLTSDALELAINNEISIGNKPDICVVDYLNLIKPNNDNKEKIDWLEQGSISENLHSIARSLEVVMLSAVQLNPKSSDNKEGNGEFGVKSLRRSSQIADNCDFLVILQTRKNEKNFPDLAIEMVKNRRGLLTSAKLQKNLECCALLENNINIDNATDMDDISSIIEE